jgi:hypothetical protein
MKYIITEEQIVNTYPDNILFVKYKLFDNSQTERKLPYDGISAWAIRKIDLNKYIKLFDYIKHQHPELGGGSENLEIVNPSGKKIFALDYEKTNNYVLGESDEIPELEPFNPKKHKLEFVLVYQNPWNQRDKMYNPNLKYQVLLQ